MNWIKAIIDWLNQNQGATLALLTAIYVIATIILVVITVRSTEISRQSLEATERFERERSRPYVTLRLMNQPLGIIQFLIENVGVTAAYNIQITLNPELMILRGGANVYPSAETEEPHPIIKKGIPYLPPNVREKNVITLSVERFKRRYPQQRFEGSITYTDVQKNQYTDPLMIDLSVNEGLSFIADRDVGTEIEKLREMLERKKV